MAWCFDFYNHSASLNFKDTRDTIHTRNITRDTLVIFCNLRDTTLLNKLRLEQLGSKRNVSFKLPFQLEPMTSYNIMRPHWVPSINLSTTMSSTVRISLKNFTSVQVSDSTIDVLTCWEALSGVPRSAEPWPWSSDVSDQFRTCVSAWVARTHCTLPPTYSA